MTPRTIGAASGTPGSVPYAFHSRAPAQDRTPATTKMPARTPGLSCFTCPFPTFSE